MRKSLEVVLVCGLVLASINVAQADVKKFSFVGNGGTMGNSATFTANDGVTQLTARAGKTDGTFAGEIYQSWFGLGVYSGGWDWPELDDGGADEVIWMDLGASYKPLKAKLTFLSYNDDYIVYGNNDGSFTGDVIGMGSGSGAGWWPTVVDLNTNSYQYLIFGLNEAGSDDNGYKVKSLKLTTYASPEISAIGCWLLLGITYVAGQHIFQARRRDGSSAL